MGIFSLLVLVWNFLRSLISVCLLGLRDAQKNAAPTTSNPGTMSLKNKPSGAMSLKNKSPEKAKPPTQSHEAMLSGPKANRCTYSINRVKQLEAKDLSGSYFVKHRISIICFKL